MPASLTGRLVVAISSRALFDFEEEALDFTDLFEIGAKYRCVAALGGCGEGFLGGFAVVNRDARAFFRQA